MEYIKRELIMQTDALFALHTEMTFIFIIKICKASFGFIDLLSDSLACSKLAENKQDYSLSCRPKAKSVTTYSCVLKLLITHIFTGPSQTFIRRL